MGDYYLSTASPCVDGGNAPANEICFQSSLGSTCLNQLTTRTDLTTDSEAVDIGFHYAPVTATGSTPTPEPTPEVGVELILTGDMFEAGDVFKLRAHCKPAPEQTAADPYIVLDIYGQLYFWPEWETVLRCREIVIDPEKTNYFFILDFLWPSDVEGEVDGLQFWSAMCDPGTMNIIGAAGHVSFGYR